MTKTLWLRPAIAILTAGAVLCAAAAVAQDNPAAPAKPAAPKPAAPAAMKPAAQARPAKSSPTEQAVLLGQFGDWGAYTASPGGKKVCFALAKPTTTATEPVGRKRDPSYAFVSTRPAEKVKNEVSVIVGYPQKPGTEATAGIGVAAYVMYTQNDGAWVKNAAEEAQMVETLRRGASNLVIKSVSAHGTNTTDTYSLKGLAEALDKVAEECK